METQNKSYATRKKMENLMQLTGLYINAVALPWYIPTFNRLAKEDKELGEQRIRERQTPIRRAVGLATACAGVFTGLEVGLHVPLYLASKGHYVAAAICNPLTTNAVSWIYEKWKTQINTSP